MRIYIRFNSIKYLEDRMRTTSASIILAVFFVLLPEVSAACSCATARNVEDNYDQYAHIFIAEITAVHLVENKSQSGVYSHIRDRSVGEFKVIEKFKGDPSQIIISAAGSQRIPCGETIVMGEWYLIFGDSEGSAYLSDCSDSQWLFRGTESSAVKILRALRDADLQPLQKHR